MRLGKRGIKRQQNQLAVRTESQEKLCQFCIGQVIQQARQDIGMSLRELTRRTGISHAVLCRIENGDSDVKISYIIKIFTALNLKSSVYEELLIKFSAPVHDQVRLDTRRKAERALVQLGVPTSKLRAVMEYVNFCITPYKKRERLFKDDDVEIAYKDMLEEKANDKT